MRSCIIAFLSVFLLSGCSGFEFRGPQTPEQKADVIRALVNSATVAGLAVGFDEDEREEQAEVASQIVSIATAVQDAVTSGITWDGLQGAYAQAFPSNAPWPPEVTAAVQSALSLASIYIQPPTLESVLDPDQLLFTRALLDGVISGATPFLLPETP